MAYKILMVDDEPLVLAGYRRLLRNYFKVHTATGAQDGFKLLEDNGHFAVVIADYLMPGIDGLEFLLKARQIAPDTVRIMLTGKGDQQVATDAINITNIYFYLNKPCSDDELLAAVIAAAEKYRNRETRCTLLKPAELKVFKLVYQGFVAFDSDRFELAVTFFSQARLLFEEGQMMPEIGRVNFYLASAIIQGRIEELYAQEDICLPDIVSEAIDIAQHSKALIIAPQELDYLKPALDWALTNKIEPTSTIYDLLNELGCSETGSAVLKINAFGALEVEIEGRNIEESEWRNPKAKQLFLFLIASRHRKAELDLILETFWPEMSSRKASNNFSTCLYSIRQVVGPAVVSYRKGHCWLEKSCFNCDADIFETVVDLGRQNKLRGSDNEALNCFNQAISLYRGDFLEEYSYLDWIAEERERLQTLLVKTLVDLSEILAARGSYGEAADVLEKVPLIKNYDDQIFYNLINYFVLAKKKGKARKCYNHYRVLLLAELGVEPDPKIRKLLD